MNAPIFNLARNNEDYGNYCVRRVRKASLVHNLASLTRKRCTSNPASKTLLLSALSRIVDLDSIAHRRAKNGHICGSHSSLAVSSNGDFVLGLHYMKHRKCRVLKYCFKTEKSQLFNYEHRAARWSVLINEGLNRAVSGANDGITVVYDLAKGTTLKVFDLHIGDITDLCHLENYVCVGGMKTVNFIDLVNLREVDFELRPSCQYAHAIGVVSVKKLPSTLNCPPQVIMIAAGTATGVMYKFVFPTRFLRFYVS